MRSANFYSRFIIRKKNAKGYPRFMATSFLAALLMLAMPLISKAGTPGFNFPSGQLPPYTVCSGLATDIRSWLIANDATFVGNATIDVLGGDAVHGHLAGFPASVSFPGSGMAATAINYTPNIGATADTFVVTFNDGVHPIDYRLIYVTINAGPALTLANGGVAPSVCSGITSTTLTFSNLMNVGPDTVNFAYAGGPQSWTVPTGVTSVKFDLMGAAGGRDNYSSNPNPGLGGRIQGTLSVSSGQALNIYVGGKGSDGSIAGAAGGYNGGGSAQYYSYGSGGAGGGATDIRTGAFTLSDRRAVAGGGGGNGADGFVAFAGGNGGGTTAGNSANNLGGSHSGGGTLSGGGAPATFSGWASGAFGTQGIGGAASVQGISGAGGGGYFGGGGGIWTGGGGGSSYADAFTTTAVTHTQGANAGDGMATIYFNRPGTYDLIWDEPISVGLNNVAVVPIPTNGQFTISIPEHVDTGTFHAHITLHSYNGCQSVDYPVTVRVKPIPNVLTPTDVNSCGGGEIFDIPLSGTVSGGSYNWHNDNPAIGADANGAGHIYIDMPLNGTHDIISAAFTITPVKDECIGDSVTFHVYNNPVPDLNSTPNPGGTTGICNNTLFSYPVNSLTTGTTFAWSRASVTDVANTPNSGTDNPNEILINTGANPVTVAYVYTLTANTCTAIDTVKVLLNPTPVLTSTVAPVCNNTLFNYHPTSATTDAAFTWSRVTAPSISNPAATGTDDINETLVNTSNVPRNATYVYSLNINGCVNTQNVVVTVNPTSAITSATTASVCSGAPFTYIPTTNNVAGSVNNWARAAIAGITPATNSGTGSISDTLTNSTVDPIVVDYVYSMTAFSCTYTQTVTLTVKPSPVLSSTLTPTAICTNELFDYTPTSATAGVAYQWTRSVQVGISNAGSGLHTNGIHEVLFNTTDTAIPVVYNYVLTAAGCPNTQTVIVTVNPLPRLSNDVSALEVCDSAIFHFVPASNTPNATFNWTRAYQAGVSNLAAFGTNSPEERLDNTTYINLSIPYAYTIAAAGCANTQNISVVVHPSPKLSSSATAATCSSAPFTYSPESYTPGTEFAWSRAAVTGITPSVAHGSGDIMDTLTQTSSSAMSVVYVYTLTVGGTTCANTQKVTVSLNPAPTPPVIGTHPAATICGNAANVNFGADVPAANGLSYSWSATNAAVVSTGTNKQFCIVDFTTAGTAVVTLTAQIGNTSCISSSSYSVTVGDVMAETPEVIYFDGQFICRQVQENGYQWGYDDAATLDSNVIVGETNQNYANAYPDFTTKKYWVMTTHNGCTQKTYYNRPTGVEDVTLTSGIKVYPNPANDFVNVEISSMVKGNVTVEVTNLLGQKLNIVSAVNNKARISVAQLPAGCYLVDCFSEGVKIGAARFIKN